jgi:biotin operon repressor
VGSGQRPDIGDFEMSKTSRLLRLMQVLRGRRHPVTVQQLSDRLSVSVRTVYRDIQALIELGAEIAGSAGVGYLLRSGSFCPRCCSPVPVTILAVGADVEAPFTVGAQWLSETHPGFVVQNLGDSVGHRAFMNDPSAVGRLEGPEVFSSVDEASRREVHRRSIDIVVPVVCSGR